MVETWIFVHKIRCKCLFVNEKSLNNNYVWLFNLGCHLTLKSIDLSEWFCFHLIFNVELINTVPVPTLDGIFRRSSCHWNQIDFLTVKSVKLVYHSARSFELRSQQCILAKCQLYVCSTKASHLNSFYNFQFVRPEYPMM